MGEHLRETVWFADRGDLRWQVWDDNGVACVADVHRGVEPDPSGELHAKVIAAAPALLQLARDLSRVRPGEAAPADLVERARALTTQIDTLPF